MHSCVCVRCVQSSTSCVCRPGMMANLVGATACTGPLVANSDAYDARSVAAALCGTYLTLKSQWKQVG